MGSSVTSGTLERHPLPRLLCYLDRKRFTGRLLLDETQGGPSEMTLLDGAPVALSPESPQHLAQLFRERGLLDDDHFSAVMHRLAENNVELDRLLVELGGLNSQEILRGRRYLLFSQITRLFHERATPYHLTATPQAEVPDESAQVAVEPLYLVHNAIRSTYDDERLTAELAPIWPHAIRLKPAGQAIAARMALDEEELRILHYLQQGYWLLDDLAEATGVRSTALTVVYCLFCADAISAAQRDSVARLRPKRPTDTEPVNDPPPPSLDALRRRAAIPPGDPKLAPTRAAAPRSGDSVRKPTPAPRSVPTAIPVTPSMGTPSSSSAKVTGDHRPRSSAPPPTATGQFAKARAPLLALRNAREAAKRIRETASLKPEAEEILSELLERLQSMEGQSPFELLGLSLDASTTDVRKAYMELVKRLHPDRLNALGLAAMHQGADALFKRITEANQTLSNEETLTEARRIYKEAAEGHDPEAAARAIEAEVDFQKGEVFYRKGDYAQAVAYFQRAVTGNPDEGEHLAMLAWSRYQQIDRSLRADHRAAAMTDLVRALTLSPRCARGHYFLGKIHLEDKNTDAALECFRKASRLRKDYIEAMREIRLIEMRRRKEGAPNRRSTLLDMFSRKKKQK